MTKREVTNLVMVLALIVLIIAGVTRLYQQGALGQKVLAMRCEQAFCYQGRWHVAMKRDICHNSYYRDTINMPARRTILDAYHIVLVDESGKRNNFVFTTEHIETEQWLDIQEGTLVWLTPRLPDDPYLSTRTTFFGPKEAYGLEAHQFLTVTPVKDVERTR